MATISIVAIKDQRNPDYGYLKLRTTTNRKHKYKSIKEKVKLSNFNQDKQIVYSKEPRANEINEKIKEVLKAANAGKASNLFKKEKSLIQFAEKLIQSTNNPNTKRGKNLALNKLKEYLNEIGKDDLKINEVEKFFNQNYYNFMVSELNTNTANEYFTIYKWFVKQAILNRLHSFEYDPFTGIKKRKIKKTYEVLTDEELSKLLNHSFKHTYKHHVQHSFKFMMFSNGLRISDFLNLSWKNFKEIDGKYFIKFIVKKTNQTHTTQLNKHSLTALLPFLKSYDEVNLDSYHITIRTKKEAKEALKEAIQENDKIKVKGFNEVFNEFLVMDNLIKTHEIVKEQSKIELKKKDLQSQIRSLESIINDCDKKIQDLLFQQITVLKTSDKGNYRVFTKLNEFPKEETEIQTHRMPSKFNYYLGLIQKDLDIKTNLSTHQARHVFAQRLFEAGENFHHISLALGHSSLEVTENYREKLVSDKAVNINNSFANTFN